MAENNFHPFTRNANPFAGLGGIMPLGLIGRAALGQAEWCACAVCTRKRMTQHMIDETSQQMQNLLAHARPVRPTRRVGALLKTGPRWQFGNGKTAKIDNALDLTDVKHYRAWDRGIGAYVYYAAQ